jgi:nicotinamidase-related amidase
VTPANTALILVGFQNDYFAGDGILRPVLQDGGHVDDVLARTLKVIEAVKDTDMLMVTTPIIFSSDYAEVTQSGGILRAIKDAKAFQDGTVGAETIPDFAAYGDRIIEVPGKRGLNAFTQTQLERVLADHGTDTVVMAGAVTSICIDSTGRAAYERGKSVVVLEDCTTARTQVEQEFFCSTVFPTYGTVMTADGLLDELGLQVA